MSIAAYLHDAQELQDEYGQFLASLPDEPDERNLQFWRARPVFEQRFVKLERRHFPGLNYRDIETADTIPKLWAFIHVGIFRNLAMVVNDYGPIVYADELPKVYQGLHRLEISWAPAPPYPLIPNEQALAELYRVATGLKREEETIRGDNFRLEIARATETNEQPPTLLAPTDPFAELRQFAASDDLTKQERAALEALCDAGGKLSLANVKTLCGWEVPIESAWNSLRVRLNKKLSSQGWRVRTKDRIARLTTIDPE